MKTSRAILLVALSLLGFVTAFCLARLALAPAPRAPEALPRTPVAPLAVERRPVVETPPAAAPAALAPPANEAGARWVELNNDATTTLAAGDLAGAVADFERCLAAQPENAIFAGNLAEALVRLARAEHERGEPEDLAHAVLHLARAIELAPTRADIEVLRQILKHWRAELELGADDWTEDSSRFELSFDNDRSDLLHHSHEVLEHLEESYEDLVRWFGADPFAAGPRLRVVFYRSADFDRLTGLGDWAAGVFDGVVRVSVEDLTGGRGWRSVLVHELVHAFVQGLGGQGVPGWLNEGLAQLLEHQPENIPRLRARLRGEELFPLERLSGSLASWQDTTEIARAYAESLVFVDYLRANFGDDALRRMITGQAAGQTPTVSFEAFTSVPLEVAFRDWRDALAR